MTARVWPVDAVAGAPSYTGRALRQLQSALLAPSGPSRPLGARSGVNLGTTAATVTASTSTWTVNPHGGVLDVEAAAAAGAYLYAFDAAVTGAMTAADANNPRIDLIAVQLSDPAESDGTTTPGVAITYVAGTPAATPAAPATPARSLVLAQISVPKTGGGSPAVTWVAPYTAASGGVIPTSGSPQYPLSPYVGQLIDDATLGLLRWDGSAWQRLGKGGDTGWQACGSGNVNVTGTAKVRRIGNQVFGQLLLAYSGGWPNTGQVTAFTLPDASYAPSGSVRMNMGGAVQTTAGTTIMSCSAGSTTVFAGANGAASGQIQWNGALWLVD